MAKPMRFGSAPIPVMDEEWYRRTMHRLAVDTEDHARQLLLWVRVAVILMIVVPAVAAGALVVASA